MKGNAKCRSANTGGEDGNPCTGRGEGRNSYRFGRGELAGRVAVVTGSGRSVGRETAFALAYLGASVVVADMSYAGVERSMRSVRQGDLQRQSEPMSHVKIT